MTETAFDQRADFTSHHIEGIAHQGNTPFSCPLITQVEGNLWQGGCIEGVSLAGKFQHVISLYPWERFDPGNLLLSETRVQLYDSGAIPDRDQLYALARWINLCRAKGATLVHCQAGLNRSALLTGLALVLGGMMPAEAIALLRERRSPAVLCNSAFEKWLLAQRPSLS